MEKIFLVTFLATGALFVLQSFLSFFGVFDGDFDDSGIGIISVKNVITFLFGLSVAGYIFMRFGYSLMLTVIFAVIFAVLFTSGSVFLVQLIRRFEQHNAIESYEFRGLNAAVTVRIEPNMGTAGKVEFLLHDRLDEKYAVTEEKTVLHPGDAVRIERLLDNGSVLVSKTII
jgi:hypothetical protein